MTQDQTKPDLNLADLGYGDMEEQLHCENCGSDNLVIDPPSVSCKECGWAKSNYLPGD
jgi:hypothetical protein